MKHLKDICGTELVEIPFITLQNGCMMLTVCKPLELELRIIPTTKFILAYLNGKPSYIERGIGL